MSKKPTVLMILDGFDLNDKTEGNAVAQANKPNIDALMKDIREKDFDGVCAHMGNVLESVTIPNYPVIAEIKQQMMRSGAKASMMSGSGPTVFGLFEDGETAKRALREMKRSGLAKQVYLTTIYNNRRK